MRQPESTALRKHPLAATMERLQQTNPHVHIRLGEPEGTGWLRADALFQPDSPHLEPILARIGGTYETDNRFVMASFLFSWYTWAVAAGGVGAYLLDGRAPDLAAANVAVHVTESGYFDQVALGRGRFALLPGDEASSHPDGCLVPDRDSLRRFLYQGLLDANLAPAIAALRARTSLGRQALWALAEDTCSRLAISLLKESGHPHRCRQAVADLVAPPCFTGRSRVLEVTCNDRLEPFLVRHSCCLAYKLPRGKKCTTCPLIPLDERVADLRRQMAENG